MINVGRVLGEIVTCDKRICKRNVSFDRSVRLDELMETISNEEMVFFNRCYSMCVHSATVMKELVGLD